MKKLIELLTCDSTDEAFRKVVELLDNYGINAHHPDGTIKDLYDVLDEIRMVYKER